MVSVVRKLSTRLRRSSVRSRSTAAAVIVVAAAMALGAAVLLLLLQRALIATVSDAADGRAIEVANQVGAEGVSALGNDLVQTTRPSQVIQVLDRAGKVVAASSPQADTKALTHLRPPAGTIERAEVSDLALLGDDDHDHLIVARGAQYGGQLYTVVVASSVGTQRATVRTVAQYLVIGFPVLLIVVAVAGWLLTGQALRPVERIRRRVQGIESSDLTERVPVPETDDEVARLASTMNEMLDRLQTGQATQRAFVADASHELRSPLATVAAGLDVLEPSARGQAWEELHRLMKGEAERMRRLVENLLLLAKADDAALPMHRTDVDLDDLVDTEILRLREAKRLKVLADVQPVRVVGDPLRLSQMIRNLVENAATAAHSTVRLGATERDGQAVLTVEDDGDGIPAEDRQRVFERFVRLDTSRARASGGSGLGLSIVQEIIKAHQGTVTLTAPSTGGTTATVTLPLP